MIKLKELKEKANKENQLALTIEVNWQETSLSALYQFVEREIEIGELVDIVDAEPVGFEADMMTLKLVVDISDAWEEYGELEEYTEEEADTE
ncbi:hypothetical protein N9955_00500 [bacterium]|nr:hypothetical protein [bacterium]